jgi:hypothetical protein
MREHSCGLLAEGRLMKAVNAFGGEPPRIGAGVVWESISQRSGYPNGQAARVAYGRIKKERDKQRASG